MIPLTGSLFSSWDTILVEVHSTISHTSYIYISSNLASVSHYSGIHILKICFLIRLHGKNLVTNIGRLNGWQWQV